MKVSGRPKKSIPTSSKRSPGRPKKITSPRKHYQLQLLTIDIIRNNYYNDKTGSYNPIECYIFQTYDGKDLDGKVPTTKNESPETIIPTGRLIVQQNNKKTIIEKWLQDKKLKPIGPYKRKGETKPYYYLECIKTHGEKGIPEVIHMQICAGPLNVLSEDCMDEVNCWIKNN
jgi:hypothetical protein